MERPMGKPVRKMIYFLWWVFHSYVSLRKGTLFPIKEIHFGNGSDNSCIFVRDEHPAPAIFLGNGMVWEMVLGKQIQPDLAKWLLKNGA